MAALSDEDKELARLNRRAEIAVEVAALLTEWEETVTRKGSVLVRPYLVVGDRIPMPLRPMRLGDFGTFLMSISVEDDDVRREEAKARHPSNG